MPLSCRRQGTSRVENHNISSFQDSPPIFPGRSPNRLFQHTCRYRENPESVILQHPADFFEQESLMTFPAHEQVYENSELLIMKQEADMGTWEGPYGTCTKSFLI